MTTPVPVRAILKSMCAQDCRYASRAARALGVSPGLVRQWRNGKRISAQREQQLRDFISSNAPATHPDDPVSASILRLAAVDGRIIRRTTVRIRGEWVTRTVVIL